MRPFNQCFLNTLNSISPTPVLRRVVKIKTSGYAPNFRRLARFIQKAGFVGIQIVQNQPDRSHVRVRLIYQPSHLLSEVHRSSSLGNFQVSPSVFGFAEHEQITRSIALVLVVITFQMSRRGCYRNSRRIHEVVLTASSEPVDISGLVRTDSSYDTIPADLEHRRLLVNGIPINYLSRWLP